VKELLAGLLIWLNGHGFPACTGQPDIHYGEDARGYVAWYQDGVVQLSHKFDREGLSFDPDAQRSKLARSALLHELVHFCQGQREGAIHSLSERAWLEREDEAYALQTIYLREQGSATVLAWRRNGDDW